MLLCRSAYALGTSKYKVDVRRLNTIGLADCVFEIRQSGDTCLYQKNLFTISESDSFSTLTNVRVWALTRRTPTEGMVHLINYYYSSRPT